MMPKPLDYTNAKRTEIQIELDRQLKRMQELIHDINAMEQKYTNRRRASFAIGKFKKYRDMLYELGATKMYAITLNSMLQSLNAQRYEIPDEWMN